MLSMKKLFPGLAGFHVHAVRVDAGQLEVALSGVGFKVYSLDGLKVQDKNSFFGEVGRALGFDVGHSWDSFDDFASELRFWPHKRVALIWKDADGTFAADAQVFVDAVCALQSLALELRTSVSRQPETIQMEVFLLGRAPGFTVKPRLQPA